MKEDQKTTVPGLWRAGDSGALISKDNEGLTAYRNRKRKFRQIDDLERRVSALEELVEKLSNGANTSS